MLYKVGQMEISIGESDSLKRIAWAYGCAKKGSGVEAELETLLLKKTQRENQRKKPRTEARG